MVLTSLLFLACLCLHLHGASSFGGCSVLRGGVAGPPPGSGGSAVHMLVANNNNNNLFNNLFSKNGTRSDGRKKLSRDGKGGKGKNDNAKDVMKYRRKYEPMMPSIYQWWERKTRGSSGLLLVLVPAMLSQLMILKTAIPFFVDRLSQYLQPVYVGTLVTLFQPQGPKIIQSILLASSLLGGLFMLVDTYRAGSSWIPLVPQEDSYAVVTGASSGIGRELAKMLFLYGFNIVMVSKQEGALARTKDEFLSDAEDFNSYINVRRENQGFRDGDIRDMKAADKDNKNDYSNSNVEYFIPPEIVTIACDLAESSGPAYLVKELKRRGIDTKIDVLVNNAGYALHGPLISAPLGRMSDMIDLNVKSVVSLTRLLAPRIAKRGNGGRIMIVSSLSGLGPGPSVAAYAATKAFLASFASSLRCELLPLGVLVTLALPGATNTNFARNSATQNSIIFRAPGLSMSADRTARALLSGLIHGRDVVVPGLVNKLYAYGLLKALPQVAIGALTEVAFSPAPQGLPFLRPLRGEARYNVIRERMRQEKSRRDRRREVRLEDSLKVRSDDTDAGGGGGGRRDKKKDPKARSKFSLQDLTRSWATLRKELQSWTHQFWYSPVINYEYLRSIVAYPFAKKGQDVVVDDADALDDTSFDSSIDDGDDDFYPDIQEDETDGAEVGEDAYLEEGGRSYQQQRPPAEELPAEDGDEQEELLPPEAPADAHTPTEYAPFPADPSLRAIDGYYYEEDYEEDEAALEESEPSRRKRFIFF